MNFTDIVPKSYQQILMTFFRGMGISQSRSRSGSRNVLTEFSPLWDRDNCESFAEEVCSHLSVSSFCLLFSVFIGSTL